MRRRCRTQRGVYETAFRRGASSFRRFVLSHRRTSSRAQETINYASVSGRVTDPQGAVVPGAQVTARQTETNVTAETVTDQEGRFRFPYLRVGPYEITVRLQGFADATRSLTLTVGSAFELPVSLAVGGAGCERHRHRRGDGARGGAQPDRRHRLADGGQEPADERAQLPRPRAARSRRVADQRRPARSSLPRRRRFPARASRSAASAISPTTSSWTACRPTTMRPG